MSKLSNKTAKRALNQLAKCLPNFDKLDKWKLTAIDAFEAKQAEKYIRSILDSNGYTAHHKTKKRRSSKS